MYTLHNLNIKRSETTKFTSRLLNTPADQNFWVARLTAYSISQGPQEPYQGDFGGPWNGKYWYIYLQYFNADWRISWPFGIVCGHLAHTFFTFWFA
jgi:hypothetical protein